jgi:hypothetical protein
MPHELHKLIDDTQGVRASQTEPEISGLGSALAKQGLEFLGERRSLFEQFDGCSRHVAFGVRMCIVVIRHQRASC